VSEKAHWLNQGALLGASNMVQLRARQRPTACRIGWICR